MISSQRSAEGLATALKFQSRNRGSFDFKADINTEAEKLTAFQSRNRGSFDFKKRCRNGCLPLLKRFNLVIEVLLISSRHERIGI